MHKAFSPPLKNTRPGYRLSGKHRLQERGLRWQTNSQSHVNATLATGQV